MSTADRRSLSYARDGARLSYSSAPSVALATPEANATYADGRVYIAGKVVEDGRNAKWWLLAFAVMLGIFVGSKWYGVMGYLISCGILVGIWAQGYFTGTKPAMWGNWRFRVDGALAVVVFISATVYGLAWIPDLVRHSPDPAEIHNVNDVVHRQYTMYEYHHNLVATHPYASKWFEWPIDYVPVVYYYHDSRKNQSDPKACCIREIDSMPNPFSLWLGLLCVPVVGLLAWYERNRGYALLFLTYMLQWLPWALSPRIAWEYHFYVNVPIICLCNAIVFQRFYIWGRAQHGAWRSAAPWIVGAGSLAIIGCFVYFWPVLTGVPLAWDFWNQHMWFPKWVVGPG